MNINWVNSPQAPIIWKMSQENIGSGTDVQKIFLQLVCENIQASERVLEYARNLHREALNARIGTAQLGDSARSFVPIAAEIGGAMMALKVLTETYKASSEEFIHAIALQVKTLRLARLSREAIENLARLDGLIAKKRAVAYADELNARYGAIFGASLAKVRSLNEEVREGTRMLRKTTFSGKYTSYVALVESAKISDADARLSISSNTMSKLLNGLTEEIVLIEKRLAQIREHMGEFEKLQMKLKLTESQQALDAAQLEEQHA